MAEQNDTQGSSQQLQLVTFRLGKEEFGVEILKVHEIIRMMQITQVPKAPDFVYGVINLRGKVIPIVSLRKRFGLDKGEEQDQNLRIIVVELSQVVVGFIVDSVSEVLKISRDIVEPPPPVVAGIESDYITGVAKLEDRLVILLDLEHLLSGQEKSQLSQQAAVGQGHIRPGPAGPGVP